MLELTGANSYDGLTVIYSGALVVNNTKGSATGSGNVHVSYSGTLAGSGYIAGNVLNLGTLSPGNSPGILHVGGRFVQANTGTLEIQAGPDGHDLLDVAGRVKLGGLLVIDNEGVLQFGDRVTFLRAGGGIQGRFSNITFTNPQEGRTRLITENHEVSVVIAPDSYTHVAANSNEEELAAALDTWIPDDDPEKAAVVEALDQLDAAGYHAAFAQMSPALFGAALSTAIEQSHGQANLLSQHLNSRRLRNNIGDGYSVKDAVGQVGKEWEAWAISGGQYSSGSMSSLSGDDFSSGLFMSGLERQIGPDATAGLFLSSGASGGNFAGKTRTEQERLMLGLYATAERDGFHAEASAGAGTLDLETRREIGLGGLSRIARSDTNGIEFSTMLSGGYDFQKNGWVFGPVASLQYSKVRYDDVDENGAGALNLRVQEPEDDSLRSRLGGRVAYLHRVSPGLTLIPEARVSWQHEFLRDRQNLDAAFEQGSGPAFTHSLADDDEDSVSGGIALGFQTNLGFYGNVSYDLEIGRESGLNHTLAVGVDWKF